MGGWKIEKEKEEEGSCSKFVVYQNLTSFGFSRDFTFLVKPFSMWQSGGWDVMNPFS